MTTPDVGGDLRPFLRRVAPSPRPPIRDAQHRPAQSAGYSYENALPIRR